jgi:hypothetical protein
MLSPIEAVYAIVRRKLFTNIKQTKPAELQWLHDHIQINGDNMNGVTHEASRHFRKEKVISER